MSPGRVDAAGSPAVVRGRAVAAVSVTSMSVSVPDAAVRPRGVGGGRARRGLGDRSAQQSQGADGAGHQDRAPNEGGEGSIGDAHASSVGARVAGSGSRSGWLDR